MVDDINNRSMISAVPRANDRVVISDSRPSVRHQPQLQDQGHGAGVSGTVPVYFPAFANLPIYTAW